MNVMKIVSVLGLISFTSQASAHGDHGAMLTSQIAVHGFTGEHLFVALGVVTVVGFLVSCLGQGDKA